MDKIIDNNYKLDSTCPHCGKKCIGFFINGKMLSSDCNCRNIETLEEAKYREDRAILRKQECIRNSNLPEKYIDLEFKTFPKDSPEQKQFKKMVYNYTMNWDWKSWLTLYGGVGTGKTATVTTIATKLIEDYALDIRYTTTPELSIELNKGLPDFKISAKEIIKFYTNKYLLIIDEIGTATGHAFNENLFTILDNRYRKQKPTILSGNTNLPTHDNEIIQRIWDRCKQFDHFHLNWKSLR